MTVHTELSATVPEEPPEGTVVLDRIKRAWQRRDGRWCVAGPGGPSLFGSARWSWLVVDCGPLIPLWSPPSASADATEPAESPDTPLPPCSCTSEMCNGDRSDRDPFRCEHCAALVVELPCPVADAQAQPVTQLSTAPEVDGA